MRIFFQNNADASNKLRKMDPRNPSASDIYYRAKCANRTEQTRTVVAISNECGDNHQRGNDNITSATATATLTRSRVVNEQKREEKDRDKVVGLQLPFATSGDSEMVPPPGQMRCSCYDTKCEIKQYLQQACLKRHLESRPPPRSRAPIIDAFSRLHGANSYSHLLLTAQRRLLSEAGGPAAVAAVYESCLGLHNRDTQVLSDKASEAGDTVLMMLCGRAPCSASGDDGVLLGQIMAFIRLYLEFKPELLFVRNNEGSNALVLAALSNKTAVATYLALIYADLGRDPNEADASHGGHTVLHVMARKGDDCVDTLEELLKLRRMENNSTANTSTAASLLSSPPPSSSSSSGRLLRLDVVNDGGKTPLDVAMACREIFSTGSGRTIYTQVIQAFHDVIEEDAREIARHMGMENATKEKTRRQTETPYVPMTFRNF